jgi:hypothetical protein
MIATRAEGEKRTLSADRFAEIERLYHEASTRPKTERPAFLDQACGEDEVLRHEVESLLSLPTDTLIGRLVAVDEAAGERLIGELTPDHTRSSSLPV